MTEATALRILSREMSDKGDDYRTDAYGIEALCLSDAADLIDKQAAENAKLREALEWAAVQLGNNNLPSFSHQCRFYAEGE